MTSNLLGVEFKQIRRWYPGNFSLNFPICLSASNDFAVKNYTNFYLTKKFRVSDILKTDNQKTLTAKITTTIKFGSNCLYFSSVNSDYGKALFDANNEHYLTIEFFENNRCRIYYTDGVLKYYMYYDSSGQILFIKSKYLSFDDSTINPQDFTYVFSENGNRFFLFKNAQNGNFFITNQNSVAVPVRIHDIGLLSYITKEFTLGRNIFVDPSQQLDSCFVTYDTDNNINVSKSDFNLTNNFLLSRPYSPTKSDTDIIVLKNQLLQEDVFSSANSMLSGAITLAVNDMRDYTTIFNDIRQETSIDLELNYVFYNKTYKISPGLNTFTSPSSMYPFSKLNINDTKFVSSGAFSNLTPLHADKVYCLSNTSQNRASGQYLLCTWLSGSPFSENKVWMDRYYYPDLIEKEEAIASAPSLGGTYDNYLESVIQANQGLKDGIVKKKFFDKISDFVFEPGKDYTYERITNQTPLVSKTYCNDYMTNYFEDINRAGMMTFAYYFGNDGDNWTILSERNSIDSGLKIVKTGTDFYMEYKIYDVSSQKYETFSTTAKVSKNNNGIVIFSIDTKKGTGYFMLDNVSVLQFQVSPYQYTVKHLLYNNFYMVKDGTKTDLLLYAKDTGNAFVSSEYTSPGMVFSIPLIFVHLTIDDLYITLPGGMRNGSDNIELLHSTCGPSKFKSNNINVFVKNLDIDNQNILDGIKNTITASLKPFIPANSKINSITFQNFK